MMIIVCPYSFGFSSSWVTDCDTAVARSEFVTEVGTTRAALRRLLDHAAPLMGVRYSLPQYGRIRSHHLALAKAKKNQQTGRFYRVAMRNQRWRGGLMCISGSFSPHGPDTLKALPRGALFSLAAPRRETPPGLPNRPRSLFSGDADQYAHGPDKGWLGQG